ncbi:Extracellular ligand-binding receptor [mine drainage metagenome]|uniref:Extracellular ligand-binding receptor n=1 Tax=mine drainage metagenome TaxID=410659 RepID=T0Y1H2_9ZZZZ
MIDETNTMKPFDVPALNAAEIEASQINASGGVDGRKIVFKVYNDQLVPALTRSDAIAAVSAGASILWVSCDVNFATPAIQVGLQHKLLTIAPCIGTDQMGPSLFRPRGQAGIQFRQRAPVGRRRAGPALDPARVEDRHRGHGQAAHLLHGRVPELFH